MHTTPKPQRMTAYERFLDLLYRRRIRPGQAVSQRELVSATGTTLRAVRELVPRLEVEGLITTVPKIGLKVPVLDAQAVSDAFRLRGLIEREAFVQFCKTVEDAWLADAVADHQVLKAELKAGRARDGAPSMAPMDAG